MMISIIGRIVNKVPFFGGGSFCLISEPNIEDPRWSDIVKKPRLISCLAQTGNSTLSLLQNLLLPPKVCPLRCCSFSYRVVIKHGLLKKSDFICDFPSKTSILLGFFT
jgi:hypothetical protein